MDVATSCIKAGSAWSSSAFAELDSPETLVVLFGSSGLIDTPDRITTGTRRLPSESRHRVLDSRRNSRQRNFGWQPRGGRREI